MGDQIGTLHRQKAEADDLLSSNHSSLGHSVYRSRNNESRYEMIPANPAKITKLATRVGKLLTITHNSYGPIHTEAYIAEATAKGRDQVLHTVLNAKKQQQRAALVKYQRVLQQVEQLLEGVAAEMQSAFADAAEKKLCNHCHDRKALPYSQYCGFCHSWAKQHAGELPPAAVLDLKAEKASKYTPSHLRVGGAA